jgi:hypothetical protein
MTPVQSLLARALALGHDAAPVEVPGGAWLECSRPGCGMGASADTDEQGAPRVYGAAVTFQCPGGHHA